MNLKEMIVLPIGFAVLFSMIAFGYCAMAYCKVFPNNTIFLTRYEKNKTIMSWIKEMRLW